uniref:Uncharacterized protein n=1 Tax=Timema poppense TaxID=170557 RepID=A0A7R9CQ11_TIMPO|nr:unnamed protein product [Timema poppensis]
MLPSFVGGNLLNNILPNRDLIRRILDDKGSDQIETEIANLLGRLTQSIQNHENNISSAEQILFSPLTLTLLIAQGIDAQAQLVFRPSDSGPRPGES